MDPEQVDAKIQEALKDVHSAMLNDLGNLISSKLSSFETALVDKQRQFADSQLSKLESLTSGAYVFKRKGNEAQYKHGVKVMERLQEASEALAEKDEAGVLAAQQKIAEGMELMSHRQKLVKLADSSKHGWKKVDQYEVHQVADDSDDEKCIFKAEACCNKLEREERVKRNSFSRRCSPLRSAKEKQGQTFQQW